MDKAYIKAQMTTANLDGLLREALKGDKESYAIFLDAVEEISPRAKEKILSAEDVSDVLEGMNMVCPNVVQDGIDLGSYEFPNDYGWVVFSHKVVEYDEYMVQAYDTDPRIVFADTQTIFGYQVKSIEDGSQEGVPDGVYKINDDTVVGTNDIMLDELDSAYKKIIARLRRDISDFQKRLGMHSASVSASEEHSMTTAQLFHMSNKFLKMASSPE